MTTEEQVFEYAVHIVMGHEGGFVDHSDDPGGATKYGITARDHPGIDIRSLTREEAKGIYRKEYWEPGGFGQLKDLKVAAKVFDFAVNAGTITAVRYAQRACNYLRNQQISEDGILGGLTAEAINSCDPERLVLLMSALRVAFYLSLVESDNKRKVFLVGWLKRALA